jgi:hypothetical protein
VRVEVEEVELDAEPAMVTLPSLLQVLEVPV